MLFGYRGGAGAGAGFDDFWTCSMLLARAMASAVAEEAHVPEKMEAKIDWELPLALVLSADAERL